MRCSRLPNGISVRCPHVKESCHSAVIVATIGHVDHGKTSLVRALTGVDTDRLPEEKARGLSIELGFAYRDAGDGHVVGFVDVPGHERFVHTMVAGVAGIHHVLVVVAADDGPMPQTVEHLAIVDLLGIASATVVITKIDRAEPGRVEQVAAEVRGMLSRTALRDAPFFHVSAPSGAGIEALAAHLDAQARTETALTGRGHFRLAVDRAFTLSGVGVVVTGTSFAGTVKVDDELAVCPRGLRARVRGLHAQNRRASTASTGERCALNLSGTGVDVKSIDRGDWLVAAPVLAPTRRIDVRVRALADSAPLRQGTRVHVHVGAKQATGRAFALEAPSLAPAAEGFVQLALDEDIGALWGDRVILRDWSAQSTLGGGPVVDPFASARGRSQPQRIAVLQALAIADPAASLAALLSQRTEGVDLRAFALARNLTEAELQPVLDAVDRVTLGAEREGLAFSPREWGALRERIVLGLDHWHKRNPDATGLSAEQLRRAAGIRLEPAVFNAMVADLVQRADIVRRGNLLQRPGHRTVMSPPQHALWQRVKRLLAEGGTRPPPVGEMAIALKMTPPEMETFLKHAAHLQLVLQVAENRFYLREALLELARAAQKLAAEHDDGLFAAAEFRDRSGIGRNLTIQVLQYFDGAGFTRRIGEARKVMRPADQVFGTSA
jgi:selenocysteine-specific elongation factor